MKKLFVLFLSLCMLSGLFSCSLADESGNPVVRISVANAGDIYVELYPETAPITVENFLSLVDRGFYDGLTFHRIISGFMVQGGDPLGNGTGGSETNIKGEFSANGVANDLAHTRGVISMARSSDMDSASSQFFIMHADAPHLDGSYAAFGKVLAGMGVVDRLCATTYVTDSNGSVLTGHAPVITAIVRVDRAEAEEAMAKEAANGKNGTFTDPTSFASFTVPKGWLLNQRSDNGSFFTSEDPSIEYGISLSLLDLYTYSAGINAVDATVLDLHRNEIDTLSLGKDTLVSFMNADPDQFVEDTVGEYAVYRRTITSQGITVCHTIGAKNGVIFVFATLEEYNDIINQMIETLIIP